MSNIIDFEEERRERHCQQFLDVMGARIRENIAARESAQQQWLQDSNINDPTNDDVETAWMKDYEHLVDVPMEDIMKSLSSASATFIDIPQVDSLPHQPTAERFHRLHQALLRVKDKEKM